MRQPSGQRHNFFLAVCVKYDASSVFNGYDIGLKHCLQLKSSLKLRYRKQISRNLLRKNAHRSIWRKSHRDQRPGKRINLHETSMESCLNLNIVISTKVIIPVQTVL